LSVALETFKPSVAVLVFITISLTFFEWFAVTVLARAAVERTQWHRDAVVIVLLALSTTARYCFVLVTLEAHETRAAIIVFVTIALAKL
jgi:hypothetical protein